MSRRLIRDDIKGGIFLNREIKHSPTDYRRAQCYYYGNPVEMCIAYFDFNRIEQPKGYGYQAEFAVAAKDGFSFDKKLLHEGLAFFFESVKFNNTRLQALISPKNRQAVRLAQLAGFQLEGTLREVADDGDRHIYSLLIREFNSKYGRNTIKT